MAQEVRSLRVQGQCRELKVVKSCSYKATSYSLLQTLLQYDVSLSHSITHRRTGRQTTYLYSVG